MIAETRRHHRQEPGCGVGAQGLAPPGREVDAFLFLVRSRAAWKTSEKSLQDAGAEAPSRSISSLLSCCKSVDPYVMGSDIVRMARG